MIKMKWILPPIMSFSVGIGVLSAFAAGCPPFVCDPSATTFSNLTPFDCPGYYCPSHVTCKDLTCTNGTFFPCASP